MSRARRLPLVQATLTLIFALLFLHLVMGVSFLSPPSINGGATTYTTDDLVCSWNGTDVTAINVSWYNGTTLYSSNATLTNSSTLPAYTARKGETWYCNVTLFNATDNTSESTSAYISNSKPFVIGVFNGTQDVGYTVQMSEEGTLILTMNASDADNDRITFIPPYASDHSFCSLTGSDAESATYSCSPVHADVQNGSLPSEIETYVNYTFVVTDGDVNGRSIIFNITPVNDAPTLSIPTQQTNVTAVFNRKFAASDEEEDYPLNATLVGALTDPKINASVSVVREGNATIRVVYPTTGIDYTDVGNRTVTINLTDARNASRLVNFTLDILSVNRPPYFTNISPSSFNTSLNQTYVLNQGQNITIDISANDPETENKNVTLNFSSSALFNVVPIVTLATNETDALGRINWTPTNDDVGNHTVIITVSDQQASNTTTLNFTINNVNDAPVINNQSYDTGNTNYNATEMTGINITPLIAYLEAPFRYLINVTDLDLSVPEPWACEHLNWTDNASEFNITSGTGCGEAGGLISFTAEGQERNVSVNITVTDVGGRNDSRIILVEIRNNTAPTLQQLPAWNTSEGNLWTYDLSLYANDTDPGDYVADYSVEVIDTNLSGLSVNSTSGLITYTPIQDQIGNYTANVTVTDTRGASASRLLNITVNNTEDYPVWTAWDFGSETIVEGHPFSFPLEATDKDLLIANSTENLTFTANLSWITIAKGNTSGDAVAATLLFMPNTSLVGDWSVQLNVTDTTGRTNSTTVAFTILNRSQPPNITAFEPYGDASNGSLVRGWKAVSGAATQENVSLPENSSAVVFAVNATDDDFAGPPYTWLNYTWYYDGEIVQGPSPTPNLTRSFDFFSSGGHVLAVTVNDSKLESATWTWNLSVANVNRPPVLQSNFSGDDRDNITLDSQRTLTDYFVYASSRGGFYDPDDDPDSSPTNFITSNHTLNLSYAWSACSVANMSASANSLTLTPTAVGSCTIEFTAQDPGGLIATSNLVTITVTQVPEGSTTTVVSSGGGGGGVTTQNTYVPLQQEVEKPKPLTIIAPKLVTIYENKSISVPLTLKNNWTTALTGIILSAETNASGVKMGFDTNYVESLPVDGSRDVMLTVEGYRLGEDFEVTVAANVSDPSFQDSALILFNSIEQSQEGKDVAVKVTFAQDLLSQNSECQELNEYLAQADEKLKGGDVTGAGELVDFVINGCKYLLSRTQSEQQKPGIFRTPMLELSEPTLRIVSWLALAAVIIVALAALLYYHHRTREEYDF